MRERCKHGSLYIGRGFPRFTWSWDKDGNMVYNIQGERIPYLGLLDHEISMETWFTIYRERGYLRFTWSWVKDVNMVYNI